MSEGPDVSGERARAASRLRVLSVLRASSHGCEVQEVAERTGLHPNTVRFHLERLEREGLVDRHVRRSGEPGRPPLAYSAAPVPDAEPGRRDFAPLAHVLAQLVAGTVDDPAAAALEAGRSWGRSYRAATQLPDGTDAVAELTAVLTEAGFAPAVRADAEDGHLVVVQRHCPFLEVAQAHPDVVCSVHLGLMRGVLETMGAPVSAARLEPFASPAGCEAHLTTQTPAGR